MPTTEPSSSDSLCIAAATALLNCVTSKDYETSRCQEQLEALRTCTKKQNVVDFNLRPTAGASKQ